MRKMVCVLAVFVLIGLGILLLGDPFHEDDSTSEPISSDAGSSPPSPEIAAAEPSTDDDSDFTQDEFDQLSQEEQDKMLEEFVLDFWEKELGLFETDTEEKSLSLEIFDRPYMYTLTEREYLQLSPEDRERADAEMIQNYRKLGSYVLDVFAKAQSLIANEDYANAEAHLVYLLEMGRELEADEEAVLTTRFFGISCMNRALKGLVTLYTQTGDDSRVQMAQERMSENEKKTKEIAKAVEQGEANN